MRAGRRSLRPQPSESSPGARSSAIERSEIELERHALAEQARHSRGPTPQVPSSSSSSRTGWSADLLSGPCQAGACVAIPMAVAAAAILASYVTRRRRLGPSCFIVARWMASSDRTSAGSRDPASARTRSLIRRTSTRRRTSTPRSTAAGPKGRRARATSVRASALTTSGVRRRRYRRRATDSGSTTASFTIAEESR